MGRLILDSRIVVLGIFLLSTGLWFGFLALIKSGVLSMLGTWEYKDHMFVVYGFARFSYVIFGIGLGAIVGLMFPFIRKGISRLYGLLSMLGGGLAGSLLFAYFMGPGYQEGLIVGILESASLFRFNALLFLIGGGLVLAGTWREIYFQKTTV